MRRYHDIVMGESFIAPLSLANAGTGPRGLIRIGRPQEEFLADVICVARRALDTLEFSIFKFHYLYAADWKLCSRKLGITRGECFHAFYRVEAKAGRAFRTTEPFPIYPVNGYLYGVVRGRQIQATSVDEPAPPVPLRPPLATKAQRVEYIRAKLAEEPLAA
jgi:hypothetical protein